MKEATENVEEGISVRGATVSLIRYADDKAVVASSQTGLQCLMDSISQAYSKYSLTFCVRRYVHRLQIRMALCCRSNETYTNCKSAQ